MERKGAIQAMRFATYADFKETRAAEAAVTRQAIEREVVELEERVRSLRAAAEDKAKGFEHCTRVMDELEAAQDAKHACFGCQEAMELRHLALLSCGHLGCFRCLLSTEKCARDRDRYYCTTVTCPICRAEGVVAAAAT